MRINPSQRSFLALSRAKFTQISSPRPFVVVASSRCRRCQAQQHLQACEDTGNQCAGDCRQAFARDVARDVEDAEPSTMDELIVNEIERPAGVDLGLDQDRRARPDRSAPEPCNQSLRQLRFRSCNGSNQPVVVFPQSPHWIWTVDASHCLLHLRCFK